MSTRFEAVLPFNKAVLLPLWSSFVSFLSVKVTQQRSARYRILQHERLQHATACLLTLCWKHAAGIDVFHATDQITYKLEKFVDLRRTLFLNLL
jgi:hypothetical protein